MSAAPRARFLCRRLLSALRTWSTIECRQVTQPTVESGSEEVANMRSTLKTFLFPLIAKVDLFVSRVTAETLGMCVNLMTSKSNMELSPGELQSSPIVYMWL